MTSRAKCLLLLLLFVHQSCSREVASGGELLLYHLTDPEAVCNDGSPGEGGAPVTAAT